jgi:hypothetical protein
MSEMTHVLVSSARFDPTKRVARKTTPGNDRYVVLANGVHLSPRGVRSKSVSMADAEANAELLAAKVAQGVIEVTTPDGSVMTSEQLRALGNKAPAKPTPKVEPPGLEETKKVVHEVKDEVKVEDSAKAEPESEAVSEEDDKKGRRKPKKGKE